MATDEQLYSELVALLPKVQLFERDFLQTWEHSAESVKAVVLLAELFQCWAARDRSLRCWDTGLAISDFRDKSTRTRFAFSGAANLLGLAGVDFDESKSQLAHGETVRETAVMVAFTAECVGIRDDLYLGHSHRYLQQFAASLAQAPLERTLPRRPTVINLQSDRDHPTQALSDLCHVRALFGGTWAGLQGRRVCVSWAYSPSYAKPLSVPQGVLGLFARFGMHITLAHPDGCPLLPDIVAQAQAAAAASGGSLRIVHSLHEAVQGAEVVYAKNWGSMAMMEERARLFAAGAAESELKAAEKRYMGAIEPLKAAWEYNEALQAATHEGKAHYMHCLPADISGVNCAAGEVSSAVFEAQRVPTYREAEHKPYVIAALMFLTRRAHAAADLAALHARPDGSRHLVPHR